MCDVYYGGHTLDENSTNPCVSVCMLCGEAVALAQPSHSLITVIEYEAYTKEGTKTIACQNEGCKHSQVSYVPAIFTDMGISTPEYTSGALSIGYYVNRTALAELEATGKTVKYGVFAALQSKLGAEEIFDENGNLQSYVVGADVTAHELSAFELKIVGFNTDEQKNSMIVMGAYVKTIDENGIEISYLQSQKPNSDSKYYFASYNEIAKKILN